MKEDKMENAILQLVESYEDPERFIQALELLLLASYDPTRKAEALYNYGMKLLNNSKVIHASYCLQQASRYYYEIGAFGKAIGCAKIALEIAKKINDEDTEGKLCTHLFLFYYKLAENYRTSQEYSKSISFYGDALKMAGKIEYERGIAVCHTNLAIAYNNLGHYKEAIVSLKKALAIAERVEDRQGQVICYGNLIDAYRNLADFRQAIECANKALDIADKVEDKEAKFQCYVNLSITHGSMQNFTKAIEYANTALEIAIEVGDKKKQSACYGNLSQAHSYLGHYTKAIEYANTALEIAIEVGDKRTQALCYGNMSFAYDRLKDFETAAEYQMKSLQIAIDMEDKGSQADGYANLGVDFLKLGDLKTSIKLQKQGLRIAEEIGNLDSQSITALSLCSVYYYKNRLRNAYDYCKRSIESLEMISERLIQEEHKISLLTKASAYELMVPICLQLKLREEAILYTERAKSRVLLDMLAKTEIKPAVELTEELQSLILEEEKYVIKLREIQTRHLRKIAKSPEEPGEIDHVLKQLKNIYEKIAKFDPEYVLMRSGRPSSLKEIVKLL